MFIYIFPGSFDGVENSVSLDILSIYILWWNSKLHLSAWPGGESEQRRSVALISPGVHNSSTYPSPSCKEWKYSLGWCPNFYRPTARLLGRVRKTLFHRISSWNFQHHLYHYLLTKRIEELESFRFMLPMRFKGYRHRYRIGKLRRQWLSKV